jgi:hypothetical protein
MCDGRYGYTDTEGCFEISCMYEYLGTFNDGLAAVKYNGKYGFINFYQEFVIEPIFDDVTSFDNGLCKASIYGIGLVLNTEGKVVIPECTLRRTSWSVVE